MNDKLGYPGPGPDFPTGNVDDGIEGGADDAGRPGGGGDVTPPPGSGTHDEPRHPAEGQ